MNHFPIGRLAEEYQRRHVLGIAVHQNDIRSFSRNVGSRSNGDANLGLCQGRGVIHSVPGHGDVLAPLLQFRHFILLLVREHLCEETLHRQLAGHCFRGFVVVPGNQPALDCELMKLSNRIVGLGSYGIGKTDGGNQTLVYLNENTGLAGFRFRPFGDIDTLLHEIAGADHSNCVAVDSTLHSPAFDGLERLALARLNAQPFRTFHDAAGDRML